MEWGAWNIKRLAVITGSIGTILSAIYAGVTAAKVAEPYWLATRGYVGEEIKSAAAKNGESIDKLERRQIRTQLYMARSNRKAIENEIATKDTLLLQNPTLPNEVRAAIQDQIRTLRSDLEVAKQEIDNLSTERLGPR